MAVHTSPVVHVVCVIVLIGLVNVHAQIHVNDTCDLPTGSPGQCRKIKNCPNAKDIINDKKGTPQLCGFDGSDPIVCCDINAKWGPSLQIGDVSKQKCSETYAALPSSGTRRRRNAFDAAPGDYPHVAILGYSDDKENITWVCGGTLISDKFVLTAAHCLNARNQMKQIKHVRLGEVNLKATTDDTEIQDVEVAKVTVHPNYKPQLVYHDIGLVELATKVKINDFVRPACLYTENNLPDGEWSIAGWGLRNFVDTPTNRLIGVKLDPVTQQECRAVFDKPAKHRLFNGIDFETQICARENVKDTCQGDSGTPLQVKNSEFDEGYKVFGVTSFGLRCGSGDAPVIYTRVSHYIEWIESIVWSQ